MILVSVLFALRLPAQSPQPAVPVEVVSKFLELSDAQAGQFVGLLQSLQSKVGGILQQIKDRQQTLDQTLQQSQPDPAVVGALVLQIRGLQAQVQQNLDAYHQAFQAMLTDQQAEKTKLVTLARQVLPVIPAFAAAQLVAPPQ
jgi:cell division protein ZapA (FtsZ GTPase activity inhibitor)